MKRKTVPHPFYAPTFWAGMRLGHWFGLVRRNRFRIHPSRIPAAAMVFLFAGGTSVMHRIQEKRCRRRIESVRIAPPPVFIVGLPRCGTTYMHELICTDDGFTAPTTFQCIAANHFLVSGKFLRAALGAIMPRRRPTDRMKLGLDRPQEDEFALCNMGLPSPFHAFAFPNNPPDYADYVDMKNLSEEESARWERALRKFFQAVLWHNPGRLVLKSPTHTGRVGGLAKMFPGAKFVRMARHPCACVPSTLFLWKALCDQQGFQKADFAALEETVLDALAAMDAGFVEAERLLAPESATHVRYEDLVADPAAALESVYKALDLGEFDRNSKAFRSYLERNRPYRPRPYSIDGALRGKIEEKFSGYARRYGYSVKRP